MEEKPKIFVSSTILDFVDLRGAIKFYLEEFGYDVQMSEYPNFNVSQDKASFDACLENIKNCKYFILIVGYRRGAWYTDNQVSITHREYLKARELIENGHSIRIVAFVRSEIYLLKNDRSALLDHFKTCNDEMIDGILTHGKSFIDDPDYIYNFLDDIGKGVNLPSETNPVNNWIFQFKEFKDIITVLKSTLKISYSLSDKRFKKLLLDELVNCKNKFEYILPIPENKQRLVEKKLDEIEYGNYYQMLKEICFNKFVVDGKIKDMAPRLIFNNKEINAIFTYAYYHPLSRGVIHHLDYPIIEQAKNNGSFLKFDITTGEFIKSELSEGIEMLYSAINSFNKLFNSNMYTNFQNEMNEISTDGRLKEAEVSVSSNFSATLFLLCLNANTLTLIKAIIKVIVENDKLPLIQWQLDHWEEQLKYYG